MKKLFIEMKCIKYLTRVLMRFLVFNRVYLIKLVSEYSDKITLFNAKEKLLSYVKNNIVPEGCSNKWSFLIDIEQVKITDEERLSEVNKDY